MTYNSDQPGIGKTIGFTILIIVAILGIAAGIWGLTVAISGPKGVGDAIIEKNSAENWTAAQARFEDMYADIQASDRKISVARDALAVTPDDKTLQTNYNGTVNYCISVVGEYNAEARKFLAKDFRSADLPSEIGDNDSASTDCK